MVAISLAAAGLMAQRMRLASLMSSQLLLGIPQQEVRYLRGEPKRISADGRHWLYVEGPGALGVIRFDAGGAVDAVSCLQIEPAATGCPNPPPMGVALGSTEDWVINRFGPSSDQRYLSDGKLIYFAELGLVLRMREFRVVGITKVPRSGRLDLLPRLAWAMLP